VKVTDANGNPVKDHQIKVTLSTTDEYTGLVGGGSARYRDAAAAVKDLLAGADVETRWKGITDSWGEVEFDFKSGFAAKTILLQAKDMTSGDVGVDYITSYKEASIDIVLTPPISRAAARRGLQYTIKVEATRTELTADGRSRSVIRATVQDPNGKPVAGDAVAFSLSSPNGTLRTIRGVTDAAGVATAEYVAGKKIGIVVVTATDTVRNISASVSITLLADAPAKIILKARPETMPADGNSRADIGVKVTDINDNPNKDTKVEFRLSRGSGKMDSPDRMTDRFGDTLNRFTAGTTPGIATIVATVRSRVPTVEELAHARNVLFVPYSDAGEEIRISKWLKRKGDTVVKGAPIAAYTFGRGDAQYTLNAPYDCRIDFQFVEYWDSAKTGDTLAQITPVTIPGSTTVPPALPAQAPRRR
ncbi:MAG TPA: Ig-like domain-containing protein, partial [Candidatus Methylomirabilis sp.]|nr:Ig-like domain-containing protein [Candidatus Methylomirabilis sp.]